MFAGRQNELKRLNGLFDSGKFECVVINGRRRVGKTALINEFVKNRRCAYFAAHETSNRDNLESISRVFRAFRSSIGAVSDAQNFSSWRDVLDAAAEHSRTERLILVLDEYPALASSYREITDIIKTAIDERLKNSKLMLIICGSSAPFMENEVLSFDSPFYGRRTAQIELKPFTFFEAKRYYTGFSLFDIAVIYGATGGVPRYLAMMDPGVPVEENIQRSFFEPDAFMFEEPGNLLRQEVREPAYYNAVLRAIASGHIKNSEIANAVGLETSAATAYLKNLAGLGIVAKKTPVTERSGKKTIYEIADNAFRFWYRFVAENMPFIMSGATDRIWRRVARGIPLYMDRVFEEICTQWLVQQNNFARLPIKFADIGRWWGQDPVRREETMLPILAYSDDDNAIFAECVWSDGKADADALASLVEKSEMFRYRNRHLYLFSRSGFTEACAADAIKVRANLVMFE